MQGEEGGGGTNYTLQEAKGNKVVLADTICSKGIRD